MDKVKEIIDNLEECLRFSQTHKFKALDLAIMAILETNLRIKELLKECKDIKVGNIKHDLAKRMARLEGFGVIYSWSIKDSGVVILPTSKPYSLNDVSIILKETAEDIIA